MLSALVSGTLIRDPKHGTSASGTKWCNSSIRCPVGQNRDGEAEVSFVSVIAFGDVADQLARLGKGDSIAVQGPLKPTEYQKDGETRHGLEIVAQSLLSAYAIRRKRGDQSAEHQPAMSGRPGREDFNDAIGF